MGVNSRGGGINVLLRAMPLKTASKRAFYIVNYPFYKYQGEIPYRHG